MSWNGAPPTDHQLPYRPQHAQEQLSRSREWNSPSDNGQREPWPHVMHSTATGGGFNGDAIPRGMPPQASFGANPTPGVFAPNMIASNGCWNPTPLPQYTHMSPNTYAYQPQLPSHLSSPDPRFAQSQMHQPQRDRPENTHITVGLNGSPERPLAARTRNAAQETTPFLSRSRAVIGSEQQMQAVPESEAKLYASFKIRPKKFFSFGKVFLTLWSEPAGESNASGASGYSDMAARSGISSGKYGERVFSKIRRFVIVGEGTQSCTALPINTYHGQGVGRQGIRKCEHAIIHTGKRAPEPLPGEAPLRGESPLLAQAIRVDNDQLGEKLDDKSRIDFGKVYTIEHNARVKAFGKVNSASEAALLYQFEAVWERTLGKRRSSRSSRPSSSRLPPVSEQGEACSAADWIQAMALLVAGGFSEDQARSVLKERPDIGEDVAVQHDTSTIGQEHEIDRQVPPCCRYPLLAN